MQLSKRTYILILLAALLLGYFLSTQYTADASTVQIGGETYDAIVVDTIPLRQKGLSGREGLPENTGMLFVFDEPGIYGFWMKDMLFSIDIIWIDENMKVVHIEENVAPETYPTSFKPNSESLYVFEVEAGETAKLGLQLGDTVEINR